MRKKREAARQAEVDNLIAKLAYAYVREVTHPTRDGVLVQICEQHLVAAINELPYEHRVRLG